MYDTQVFEIIDGITPSPRGELEITSVNNAYIARGQLAYSVVRGRWADAGTFESLREAGNLLLSNDNRVLS
jgi:glucose-1-phosphate thymidylyltransferase